MLPRYYFRPKQPTAPKPTLKDFETYNQGLYGTDDPETIDAYRRGLANGETPQVDRTDAGFFSTEAYKKLVLDKVDTEP